MQAFFRRTPSNGKTYLKKSSKALAALRKVVLDKKWLSNLAFYVRFTFVISKITYNIIRSKGEVNVNRYFSSDFFKFPRNKT